MPTSHDNLAKQPDEAQSKAIRKGYTENDKNTQSTPAKATPVKDQVPNRTTSNGRKKELGAKRKHEENFNDHSESDNDDHPNTSSKPNVKKRPKQSTVKDNESEDSEDDRKKHKKKNNEDPSVHSDRSGRSAKKNGKKHASEEEDSDYD